MLVRKRHFYPCCLRTGYEQFMVGLKTFFSTYHYDGIDKCLEKQQR